MNSEQPRQFRMACSVRQALLNGLAYFQAVLNEINFTDFSNLKGIGLETDQSSLYKLDREIGILNSMYSCQQFAPAVDKFMVVSLRETARTLSIGLAQDFFKFSFKTYIKLSTQSIDEFKKFKVF